MMCSQLDRRSHLYVFGQVISGMDVVDKIASVATDDNDKPTETVTVTSVEVVKDASSK
ncbi:peptidylprolyl isomerase [Weissella confusa]|uniref:Peptidylprolyl isomerase n=1 Tax=Weissella confusa TaxID=1583 RepID=A0A923NGA3_WEICO|nr:peptidylprolyl isomerase [Weissella confusa]